jgi:hypothetical protein
MRGKIIAILLLAGWACLAGSAHADITYQYVTDQTTYSAVNAGDTVTVQLFLQETLTNGSTSIINTDNGMFGAGVGINQSGTIPANATKATDINFNNAAITAGGFGAVNSFDLKNTASDGSNTALSESIGLGQPSGPQATLFSNSGGTIVNRVLLGTATLQAGAVGTSTTFQITSLFNSPNSSLGNGNEGNTLTVNSGFDLDSDNNNFNGGGATYNGADDINNTFTVTVGVVPEPSSLLLAALGLPGLIAYGVRHWRRRAALVAMA